MISIIDIYLLAELNMPNDYCNMTLYVFHKYEGDTISEGRISITFVSIFWTKFNVRNCSTDTEESINTLVR